MLEVKCIGFCDLTEEEKIFQPENGSGKEYATYLQVSHNGETIGLYSDAMEPEDCVFYRDLSWIQEAIASAYELGKKGA